MKAEVTLTNKATGAVFLICHAWIRFLTRHIGLEEKAARETSQHGESLDRLAATFAQACVVTLPRHDEARRQKKFGCPVTYLHNHRERLRFVITNKPPKTLLTVERPNPTEIIRRLTRQARHCLETPQWYRAYFKTTRGGKENLRWL